MCCAQAAEHKGAAFVEIYQNCNVFNDHAFDALTDKETKALNQIRLVHGEPIRFGAEGERGVVQRPDGGLEIVEVADGRGGRAARARRAPQPIRASRSRSPTSPSARPARPRSACSARSSGRSTARRSTPSSTAAKAPARPRRPRDAPPRGDTWAVA